MKKEIPQFVKEYENRDNPLYEAILKVSETAFAGEALDHKTKLLIALALDAVLGSEHGVASLARQIRSAGGTDEEINEALRVAYYVAGMNTLVCGNAAYKGS